MRVISGELRVEARAGGRALLILRSANGEEIAMERSPEQLAALRERLGEIAAPPAAPSPEPEPAASTPVIEPPAPSSDAPRPQPQE